MSGTCAKLFKSEVQFGHAGARSGGEEDSAQAKNAALKAAGAIVPESFEGLEEAVRVTFEQLVADGVLTPTPDVEVPEIPMDLATAVKLGKVGVTLQLEALSNRFQHLDTTLKKLGKEAMPLCERVFRYLSSMGSISTWAS